MPVEDINQMKMAEEFLNTIQTVETTTEFWSNNNAIISYFVNPINPSKNSYA